MSINWPSIIIFLLFIAIVILSIVGFLRFVFKNR
ncbi:hypothetical protein CM49_04833 [Paenibacillus sp. P1XP2]|nr:hypothetical protein CM49_04833 [Paenibacillus sp. P1XP2]